MAIQPAITIDASVTLAELRDRIAGEDRTMNVVIRRDDFGTIYWYATTVAELERVITRATVAELDLPLAESLSLQESGATPHFEVGTTPPLVNRAVALDGPNVAGVLLGEDDRLGGLETMPPTPEPAPVEPVDDAAPPPPPPVPPAPAPPPPGGREPAGTGPERKPFSSYPSLLAPEQVASQQEFDLEVGLARNPVPGVAGGTDRDHGSRPLRVRSPGRRRRFLVPAGKQGHAGRRSRRSPEGFGDRQARRPRRAKPDRIDPGGVVLPRGQSVRTGDAVHPGRRRCRDRVPSAPEATGSVSLPDTPAPDLTVTISHGADDTRLAWTLATPHDIPDQPTAPLSTKLDTDSAQDFALERVRSLADWDKNPLTPNKLVGIGEEISGAMPIEFWTLLDAILEKKQAAGGPAPSVLIVSEDPYVPWELAAMTDNYARPERLDPARPAFLGAQLRVGRWAPPVPTPFGGDIPSLPPATGLQVGDMVVFVGDYDAMNGQHPLPLAMEEGEKLAEKYQAIKRNAVVDDVNALLDDTVTEDGQSVRVDAIHFACHGEVSSNPRHNGIVLSDNQVRFDPDMVSGSKIGETSNPFVFLNACQLGLGTAELDGSYGGLAGAFLKKGATGFVSPLWSVDDKVAQEVALGFYEAVFEATDTVSVADVLSGLRSRFDTADPEASYLAYVYYGHPDLVITKPGSTHGDP